MRLFFYRCFPGFGNCYVLGTDDDSGSREAVIVDPGSIDNKIIDDIEGNGYTLRAVLITHEHKRHVYGLRTLKRIYDVGIFAMNSSIMEFTTTQVKDADKISIGPFNLEVIAIPGHSADSAIFLIDRLLFTGDVLTAGLVGSTQSSYGAAAQMNGIQNRILTMPGDYTVLPGHGPPSTLEAERRFNVGINQYRENHDRRQGFRVDL